jgi:hypothetical protein
MFDVVVVDEATAHVKQLHSDGTMDDDYAQRGLGNDETPASKRTGGDLYVRRPERHIA